MKIKDQIRARREQLGVTVNELANRVGVSTQAIRYWESGRSFPAKSKAPSVEAALSFVLDWTEGKKAAAIKPQMAALVSQEDIDLLLLLSRLPVSFKDLIASVANEHLAAITGKKKAFSGKVIETPAPTFTTKEKGRSIVSHPPAKKRGRPRKAAA
jgi:transcriptional regulator with XRE-family HTH domain